MEETLQTYVLPHWPFVFMSFSLGMIGQFVKKNIWTFDRAVRKQGVYRFMYTTMGLHAPIAGAILGLCGAPVSPGITGWAGHMLYHFGAGASAAWVVAACKHFMQSRGIIIAESIAPPVPSLQAPQLQTIKLSNVQDRASLAPDAPASPIRLIDPSGAPIVSKPDPNDGES